MIAAISDDIRFSIAEETLIVKPGKLEPICMEIKMFQKISILTDVHHGQPVRVRALTKKAYSYLCHLYRVIEIKTPAVTPPCLTPLVGNYGTG